MSTISSAALVVTVMVLAQLTPRTAALLEALRPALPYPASTPAGDLPADNSPASKWFVVWPRAGEGPRVIVRANPLHPEVKQVSAAAMDAINKAVAAAERRARESYDKALERLRATGKTGELDPISLDDEGAAGQRIDAELEVTIELTAANDFEVASAEPPIVTAGSNGPDWIVRVAANTYHIKDGGERREQFRAEEAHLYFGIANAPIVGEAGDDRYRVTVTPVAEAFTVAIRGNATLVSALTTGADWKRLAPR